MMQVRLTPEAPHHAPGTRLGCLYAFLAPFVALSLFLLFTGIRKLNTGDTREGWMAGGVAMLLLAGAGGSLAFGIRSHRRSKARLKFESEHPTTPWLWRPEWRDGRMWEGTQ